MPYGAGSSTIQVQIGGQSAVLNFDYAGPVITAFSPAKADTDQLTLTITGLNFGPRDYEGLSAAQFDGKVFLNEILSG